LSLGRLDDLGETVEKVPYLYVTGTGFSGSTLLAFLLNAHPHMVSVGEIGGPIQQVVVEKYPCSCGELLLKCPFFLELEQQINALGTPFSLTNWQTRFQLSEWRLLDILLWRPLRSVVLERVRDKLVPLWPGFQEATETIGQRILHFAKATLTISGKQVFVDTHKDSARIRLLQKIERLDLRVIHLVRDVRGGVASRLKNYETGDVAWATRAWRNVNMNSERARRHVFPHQWLRLRYSEVCLDPQGTVDRISDFVGVERAPIPTDLYQGENHIIGNRMREMGSGIVKEDLSWKDRLSKRDLDVIAQIGGRTNRYLGYNWP